MTKKIKTSKDMLKIALPNFLHAEMAEALKVQGLSDMFILTDTGGVQSDAAIAVDSIPLTPASDGSAVSSKIYCTSITTRRISPNPVAVVKEIQQQAYLLAVHLAACSGDEARAKQLGVVFK